MKVLGVNGAGSKLWLSLVGDDGPEDTDPPSLELAEGVEGGFAVSAFRAECRHVLARLDPDRVVILDPEPTGNLAWKSVLPRVAAEVLLVTEAAASGISCERVSRAGVRSAHQLGRSGRLASHVGSVFSEPVGKYWTGKRDLAALAAAARHEGS